jgi:DNA (cytosine-5)-methyltransferase 1
MNLKALSLFSNVGIAETFFHRNGVDVVLANELIPERGAFYKYLNPNCEVIIGDVTNKNIFEQIYSKSQQIGIDLIIATPPCQGMSNAGNKDKLDPRNNLIYYAVELIKLIKPAYVLIENVPTIENTTINLNGNTLLIPEYISIELSKFYNFNANRIVNAMDYGVPQSRKRYILLLSKKSNNFIWEFPVKNNYVITLEDAIGNLPSLDPELSDEKTEIIFPYFHQKKQKGLSISKWHYPPVHSWKLVEIMIHTPSGKSAFTNENYFPKYNGRRVKGAPRTYMRMSWDKPSPTILMNNKAISTFSTVHPGRCIKDSKDDRLRVYSDPRVLTVHELLILSSLPLSWNIPNWASEKLIREVIGEGIPPLLSEAAIKQLK